MKFVGSFQLTTPWTVRTSSTPREGVTRRMTNIVTVDEDGNVYHLCHDATEDEVTNAWVQVSKTQICRLDVEPDVIEPEGIVRGHLYDGPVDTIWNYADGGYVPADDWPAEASVFRDGLWTLIHPSGRESRCSNPNVRICLKRKK